MWHCGVHVREQRLLEVGLALTLVEPLDAPFGAVEEVEEVALGRRRVVMWELAPVDTREAHAACERRHEAREPHVVGRVRILAREDEDLASGEVGAEVARATVPELGGRDLVHVSSARPRNLDAVVARARVDDDDLDFVVHDLRRESRRGSGRGRHRRP